MWPPCFVVLESGNWRSVGRSAIERAKWRLLRPPRLRHCIGGDGGGTWPLAPPVAAAAPDRSKRAGGSVTPLSPSVRRLFVLVNGHRSDRTEKSRCHKKPTFLPFISYVLMAHGMTAAGRSSQQPAACPRHAYQPSPRSSFLTALAAPSWLKCPLFAIVDVPPSVAHKDSFFTVYHCRSTHLRARRPSAARSFPRSRNGTSRLGLRGKEGKKKKERRKWWNL